MALGKHQRTNSGAYRRERRDARVQNLKQDYPQLREFRGNTKLGTLEDRYDVNSLNQLLKAVCQKKNR